MQENKSQNAIFVLSKLKKILKTRTDRELSLVLNVRPNTLSTWKKRNTLDYSLIISICKEHKIDLCELFWGKEALKTEVNKVPLIRKESIHEYTNGQIGPADLPQYSLPFINRSPAMIFQVGSNDMFPVLEENAFAICEKTALHAIENQSVLVLVSRKKGFFINRFEKMEGASLLLFNDNSMDREKIKIKAEVIDEWWEVIGSINYNLDTNKMHLFNARIQKLEALVRSKIHQGF